MSNIIIKKLEDRIFDSNKEALDRLNDLGRNDIDSEMYKDLADQVRSTCPCQCYISNRKAYDVEINYKINRNVESGYVGENLHTGTALDFESVAYGYGRIEKGSLSKSINTEIHFNKYSFSSIYNGNSTQEIAGCTDILNKFISLSISLSSDCKHWIFNFTPIFGGYYSRFEAPCEEYIYESSILKSEYLIDSQYPQVDSIYPHGTMKLVYEKKTNTKDEDEAGFYYDNNTETVTIEVTVKPIDNVNNSLNSINELYDDLDKNLKL